MALVSPYLAQRLQATAVVSRLEAAPPPPAPAAKACGCGGSGSSAESEPAPAPRTHAAPVSFTDAEAGTITGNPPPLYVALRRLGLMFGGAR